MPSLVHLSFVFTTGPFSERPLVISKSALGLYILHKENVQDLDAQVKTNQVAVVCVRNDSCENKFLHDCKAAAVASHFCVRHNRLAHLSLGKMNFVSQHAKF